jgi:aspartyl-tRNA(Asn)/glutamyl-tRNA(Gln) amidotransferase subunit A
MIADDFSATFRQANPLSAASHSKNTDVDSLLAPTSSTFAPSLDVVRSQSVIEEYTTDVLTVPASLAGLPAITVPLEFEGGKTGMQLIAQFGQDEMLLQVAEMLEEIV